MSHRNLIVSGLCVLVASSLAGTASAAAIAVANWNVANHPNSAADTTNLETVLRFIGTSAGRPLDLLGLMETDTASVPSTIASMQSVFSTSTYASVVSNPDGGGDRTGFLYNTATLNLLSSSELALGSLTHRIIRAHLQPVGGSADTDFYIYSVHLKSGSGTSERATRTLEAQQLRADADALGAANVIFVGDFNWQGASERGTAGTSAYEAFNAAGNGRVSDAINQVGAWNDNAAFKSIHTNDPGGAMDDRFDMQLISDELRDGSGIDYLGGSYDVIGNNGTHALNGTITTGTGAPPDVLGALANFSDHLPVLARYTFAVPEPASLTLIAVGCILLRRRR